MNTKQSKKYRLKKSAPIKILVIIGLVVLISAIGVSKIYYSTAPANAASTAVIPFTINSGASTKSIAQNLEEEGIIKRAGAFTHYVKA